MTRPAPAPIRLVLIDDSELVRRGIKTVFNLPAERPIRVVGEAGTVAAGVAECQRERPDVVLLDIRLPDGSGFEACRKILHALPETRIVMLTAHSNDDFVYEAVTAGARGYLLKEIDSAALVRAVHDVADGHSILDPDATARVLRLLRGGPDQAADLSLLSTQERRVLTLVAEGLTNKQIGGQLGLSENTVKNYLVSVFEKLHVKRRAQAAAVYVNHAKPSKP